MLSYNAILKLFMVKNVKTQDPVERLKTQLQEAKDNKVCLLKRGNFTVQPRHQVQNFAASYMFSFTFEIRGCTIFKLSSLLLLRFYLVVNV